MTQVSKVKKFDSISESVAYFLQLDPADGELELEPHQLNPFLRALEPMQVECMVLLNYMGAKPRYIIMKWIPAWKQAYSKYKAICDYKVFDNPYLKEQIKEK